MSLRSPFLERFRLRLPGSGRAWRLLVAALALLACAGSAQAQTAAKLVSNTGQTHPSVSATFDTDIAQAFTTGSHSSGYRLTRVDFQLQNLATTPPVYSVSIRTNSSGSPGTSVGTLTNPTSLPTSFQITQYSAPEGGIALSPNTTYFVMIDSTSSATSDTKLLITASDNEDSDSESGWSIADTGLFRNPDSTGSWTTSQNARKIAVHGYAAPPMVSNTTTIAALSPAASGFRHEYAQQFTTGSGTGGYTLNAVALPLKSSSTTTPVYSVSIQGDSSSLPDGTNLGTLTTSATLTAAYALVEFAAASAITLAANTDYWVVIDVSTGDANTAVQSKETPDEDAGALPGWSIASGKRWRENDATTWETNLDTGTMGIAVYGTSVDQTAPAFQSATVNGTALSVTFNENLYSGSAPAGTAFALSGGQSGTGTATISGATVSVTLGSAVAPGASVTLGYTPPASGKKLQDAAGNFGARFAGQPVANLSAATGDAATSGPHATGPHATAEPPPPDQDPQQPPATTAGHEARRPGAPDGGWRRRAGRVEMERAGRRWRGADHRLRVPHRRGGRLALDRFHRNHLHGERPR